MNFGSQPCIVRGTTAFFATTFYDRNGDITQPIGAAVNISYFENGQVQTELVDMTPPSGSDVQWTATWDTRGVSPGLVSWSVHSETSDDAPPFVADDGAFELTANNANLPTF